MTTTTTTTDIAGLRARVALACRVLGGLDLAGNQGHVSARIPGRERALIRARGPGELGVRYTSEEQIVEIDFDGNLVEENDQELKSPVEAYIHTEVYRARPDVMAVVHIHPEAVVLLTACNKPLLPIFGAFHPASLQLVLAGIPTYPTSTWVDTPARGQALAAVLAGKPVCLMHGHGITATGSSVEDAALAAINLNELASMNYRAYVLGDPQPISDEDQAEFRRAAAAGRGSRVGATWRYYCTLTGQTAPGDGS